LVGQVVNLRPIGNRPAQARREQREYQWPLLWSDRKLGAVPDTRNVTIAPDGKRSAALMPAQNQAIFLLNFSDELRRKFGDTRR
jgi:hypothetical protein